MGKTMQKVKMWNFLDNKDIEEGRASPVEVEAQIDNGSVKAVLPKSLADQLKLQIRGTVKVRYADMREAERELAFGLMLEILGRCAETSAIIEPDRQTPRIGQIILEELDLWIDSKNGKLMPNPTSPDMPLLDEI